MAVVQRRPGTKQGLVSRLFDGESARSEKKTKEEVVPVKSKNARERKKGK